jgi:hypothetical protein
MNAADQYYFDERVWRRGRNLLALVGAVSVAAAAAGWAENNAQFAASYVVSYVYFTIIALGAAFFVMLQHLTGSAWSVTVRRMMENLMAVLPASAVLFAPIALNLPALYEWAHPEFYSSDPVMQFKIVFFNPAFYMLRMAAYFLVWTVLAVALYRNSIAQDEGGSLERIRKASAWSAPGLLALMVTVTMAAVDLLMSLEPHWYSTIFGIYVYSGGALAFVCLLTLICLGLRRAGYLRNAIHVEHYHDLGKWQFALTIFWAYIAFSQYLLIWYANIPEETIWFKHRLENNWAWVSGLLLGGRFILPFLALLSRAAKRSLGVLGFMSAWGLLMHWVDVHWVVMPTLHRHAFHVHWLDVATFLAVGSLYGLVFWTRLRNKALAPVGDLRFEQALHFKNI